MSVYLNRIISLLATKVSNLESTIPEKEYLVVLEEFGWLPKNLYELSLVHTNTYTLISRTALVVSMFKQKAGIRCDGCKLVLRDWRKDTLNKRNAAKTRDRRKRLKALEALGKNTCV